MMREETIWSWLDAQEQSLEQWREPDGLLIATEPDAEARERVRERLRAQIFTIRAVLAGQ